MNFDAESDMDGQIFRIGTVRYAESLWRMRRHGPVIAHCTDSEDFPMDDTVIVQQSPSTDTLIPVTAQDWLANRGRSA